jgi:hypothetical protein
MEPQNVRGFRDQANESAFKHDATQLPNRPGVSTAGKAIQIRLNQFKITQMPNKNIYQYDVSLRLPNFLLETSLTHSRFLLAMVLKSVV